MPKLNQILAIEQGQKNRSFQELTDAHHALQKPAMLAGISRTYQPKDEEGDKLPPESTLVMMNANEMLERTAEILTKLFDVTATKDWTNCVALASVKVDGTTLLDNVPATFLLFLEKKLVDIHTFISKLPVLDPSEKWTWDTAANCFATEPTETVRTKKVMRNHVKAEATDKHPAQVDVYTEDVIVGRWKTIKFSGALPAQRVKDLLDRVDTLMKAVKFAREEANMTEAVSAKVGDKLFSWLFA